MLSEEQQQLIKSILSPLQPIRIGIFGSVARNDYNKKSDLDILIDVKGKISLFDIIEVQEQLSNALNRKVDLITERSLHPSIRKYIETDLQLIA